MGQATFPYIVYCSSKKAADPAGETEKTRFGALLFTGRSHGDLFSVLGRDFTRGNGLYLLECLCRIEAISTFITHPDHHVLKDDKARFVFKRFALHPLRLNRSLAVFAPISELWLS